VPYDLRIEGHTDNIPIHTVEFDSNWELSSARATRIARLFLDMQAISPERLSPPAMRSSTPSQATTPLPTRRKPPRRSGRAASHEDRFLRAAVSSIFRRVAQDH